MSGPELITLGCRLNIAESEAMRALARDEDDLIIVNSCAVTAEAVRQTRHAIRRAKRARPEARIVVAGCAAQIDPAAFAAMPEVARVIGNSHKQDMGAFRFAPADGTASREEGVPILPRSTFGVDTSDKILVSDIMAVRETAPQLVSGFAERTRAFVEIQNGCDHRCTFCIIPYGRGNSRSAPPGPLIDRIKALIDEGYREVVLTGVDITSYGPDLPGEQSLGHLVERILRHVPDLQRLRLSSIDSVEIDERLFDLVTGDDRIMPHLHLSLQAGDDMILKRMKRRHSRAQAVEMVARLKAARPGIAIGADLIAGFPTETEDMAANSLQLIDDCDIVFAHVFPYSPRAGTPAARMPQVDPRVVRERASRLRRAGAARKTAWLQSLVGSTQEVLLEKGGRSHAGNFAEVRYSASDFPPISQGDVTRMTIAAATAEHLIGLPA
ncbi:tRNA (N(6)-L-threonylcarbamoyladenosine(37)-C(2))-methylthiotransferase MtaB [Flavisphingomonas formosensis]|uniref:tRNA (N(6)-L-threonylcarbamoyladenosine(37)-C(2))- methylthiotransferase MtaB n=1 Tax=Flavisphingomonas formosensis TaxID=861534 RepID=UPI0012FA6BFD|nr:tRNA (N(6)-L-threonylcarbamoyladenosine(37)-C(2))-methylthiotransferase MtaB [Sphingomonas formosensis]